MNESAEVTRGANEALAAEVAARAVPESPVAEPRDESGRLQLVRSPSAQLDYRLYLPRRRGVEMPLLVAVHGISRNDAEHAAAFRPWAERMGAALVVPSFPRSEFGDYQRLGREGRGRRADRALLDLLDELRERIDGLAPAAHLFGFSGGGQFVHRFSMAHPDAVAAQVVAAAGWYTFPDRRSRFPYGLRGVARDLPGGFSVPGFLRVPTGVVVGEWDVERDPELRRSRSLDASQGTTRLERGFRWTRAMRLAAESAGLETPFHFRVLPASGHDFSRCVANGRLAEVACELLFDALAVGAERRGGAT